MARRQVNISHVKSNGYSPLLVYDGIHRLTNTALASSLQLSESGMGYGDPIIGCTGLKKMNLTKVLTDKS